jgi:hypothetical protein
MVKPYCPPPALRPRPTPRRRRLSEGYVHAPAGGIERDCAPDAAARARETGGLAGEVGQHVRP